MYLFLQVFLYLFMYALGSFSSFVISCCSSVLSFFIYVFSSSVLSLVMLSWFLYFFRSLVRFVLCYLFVFVM